MHPPPAGGHSSGSSSLRRAFRATNLGLERRLTPSNVDAKEPRLLISYNVWWQWLDGLQHVADELKSGAATPMLLRLRHEESGASWDVPLKPRVKDGMQLEPSTLAVLLGALGARAGHHLVFELVASECSSAALAAKVRLVERPCGRPPVPHSAPVDLPGRALPRLMPPLQNAVCQQRYEEAVMCKGSGSEAVQAVPENEGADTEAGAPRRNQRRYAQQAQAEAWTRCDNIIQELYSMSGGAVQQEFGHPVDPERFPAYRIIVKRPMDLGSIEARLPTAWGRPDAYDSPLQFRDDVRLVFDNCRLYSVPGTTLRKLGEAASAKFEKLWAAEEVERFWQQGQQPEGAAAAPTAAGVQPAAQPPEQQTAAPAPTEQQGQQPPPAPQQQQPPQASEPTPPPDAHSYHGQHWEHRSPYASSAPRGPTPVSFAKKTLQKLFGWQHGSDKNIRPTAVLRYVPAGSTQSVEAEVQLLPPGRDDAEVQARKEEGGARPKVDGYRLPTEALRALYQGLAAPEGARLRFTSAGWRGTQLVFDVSLLPADGADATAASMGGSMPAADSEPQVAERTGPAHDAAAAAAAQVQAPTSGAAPAAAATQAAAAPAAAGSAAAAGAQPEAAAGAGPTPEPAAAPAATPAAPQGDALLDGLAAAAEAASSGHQPLAAIAGSFDAAAQAIIQRGREGWLSTESVYDLLVHGQEWGIEPAVIAPVRPAAGDLFLVDGRKQLERRDGHNWVDRCSAKLRLKGREAVQVVYHTTADRSLQRRWFYLLDDPSSHAHLLHYQLPEPKLTGRRQRGSRRKSDWAEVGEPEAVAAKRSRQPAQGGESLQGANAAAAADASAHPLPAAECRQTARPHADTANDLQRALSSALQAARPAAQQQQCVQQGMTALETAGDDPAAWHAALELLVQGGVGGKVLQDAVVGWDALTPQQHCGVHVVVLRAAVEGGWAQLEARLREVLAQAPLAEGASAAAVAPAGVPAQPSAGLVAAFQAAQQQRSQPVEPPKPPQPPPQGSLSPAPAAASAAPSGGAADPATRAAQLADESSGTNRLAVFQALQRILRRAGVAGGDMQAFLKRHVMDNPDGEQRAMHWSILSEHDREREDDLICAWVQQNL